MGAKKEPTGFNPQDAPREPAPDKVHAEPMTIQVGGKDYRMGRIRLSDIAAATARLRSLRLRALLAEQGAMTWRIASPALAHCACIDPTDEEIWQFIESSAEGTAYILWRVMSQHNPGLTFEQTQALIEEEPSLIAMLFVGSELQRPARVPEGEQRENPPVFQSAESATGQETQPSSPGVSDGHTPTSPISNGPSTFQP